jgi:hypothetical protein
MRNRASEEERNGEREKRGGKGCGGWGRGRKSERGGRDLLLVFYLYILFFSSFFFFESRETKEPLAGAATELLRQS